MSAARALLASAVIALALCGAAAASCTDEVGRQEAARLAGRCREVSPATRPPCNPANSCALIRDEIRRSCTILGNDAPDFCGASEDDDEDDD